MKLDGRIVEGDRHARHLLDRRNQVGQEFEHLCRLHAHRLRAVDVQREIVDAQFGLPSGQMLEGNDIAIRKRPPGASERIVHQFADQLKGPTWDAAPAAGSTDWLVERLSLFRFSWCDDRVDWSGVTMVRVWVMARTRSESWSCSSSAFAQLDVPRSDSSWITGAWSKQILFSAFELQAVVGPAPDALEIVDFALAVARAAAGAVALILGTLRFGTKECDVGQRTVAAVLAAEKGRLAGLLQDAQHGRALFLVAGRRVQCAGPTIEPTTGREDQVVDQLAEAIADGDVARLLAFRQATLRRSDSSRDGIGQASRRIFRKVVELVLARDSEFRGQIASSRSAANDDFEIENRCRLSIV